MGLLLLYSLPAHAQITPKYEIGGGFDFTSFGPQATTTSSTPRLNSFGWNANGAYNLLRIVGVAVDVSGVYNVRKSTNANVGNSSTQIYPFLAGPRFYPLGHRRLTLFGQVLFGQGYIRENVPTVIPFSAGAVTSTGYAWEAGGGVDYSLGDHWAFRMLEVSFLNTHFFGNGQSSERATIGVVYRFGVVGARRRKK